MKATVKRLISLSLALVLIAGQIVLPAYAEDTEPTPPTPTTVQVDVSSLPGGVETEKVDVIVTVDANGNVTALATPAGGDVTASGSTVNYDHSVTTDPATGTVVESTTYDAVSADGNYDAQGGKTVTTENLPQDPLNVTVIKDGQLAEGGKPSAGGGTVTTTEGSLKSNDPANFDQTTTTTTQREVEVKVDANTVITEGESTLPETETDHDYSDAYDKVRYKYWDYVKASKNADYIMDENGEFVKVEKGTGTHVYKEVEAAVVWTDANGEVINDGSVREWSVIDQESGELIRGLYCVDASTSTMPFGLYRIANLEDAAEEGYYSEEEAKHLRAIVTYGYDWQAEGGDNLADMTQTLLDQNILSSDEAMNFTAEMASTATNMAIWKYGNRFTRTGADGEAEDISSSDLTPSLVNKDLSEEEIATIMKVYEYLAGLTMEAPEDEKQIINEEKFIDDMIFTVGDKVDGAAANQDNDDTNDVYNTSIKFSLVVTPDPFKDNLLVSVVGADGSTLKTVRIAGGDDSIAADDNGYYTISDIQLAENSDSAFNLVLSGTQDLQKGVYVFEAKDLTMDQLYEAYGNWQNKDAEWAKNDIANRVASGIWTEADVQSFLRSQNFITMMEGTAKIDVSTNINLSFNVEEGSKVTIHEWRKEKDPAPGYYEFPEEEPAGGGGGVMLLNLMDDAVPMAHELDTDGDGVLDILDEEVPLAAAPATGDASVIWAITSVMSLAGYVVLGKKKEEN